MSEIVYYTQEEYDELESDTREVAFDEGYEQGQQSVVNDPYDFLSHSDIDALNQIYADRSGGEWLSDSVYRHLSLVPADVLKDFASDFLEYLKEHFNE